MAGRLDVLSAWAIRSERLPLLGCKKSVSKRRNDEAYKAGPYNSFPVVLHCNCYVLDRVYLTVTRP